MRSRILFATLIPFSLTVTPSMLFGQKKNLSNHVSLKQQVDQELHNLQKNVKKAASLNDKLKFIDLAESKIRDLRSVSPRQRDRDELYFDIVLASLEEIPRQEYFKKDRCDIYKQSILNKYDPEADSQPKNPAVKKTVGVLESICH